MPQHQFLLFGASQTELEDYHEIWAGNPTGEQYMPSLEEFRRDAKISYKIELSKILGRMTLNLSNPVFDVNLSYNSEDDSNYNVVVDLGENCTPEQAEECYTMVSSELEDGGFCIQMTNEHEQTYQPGL